MKNTGLVDICSTNNKNKIETKSKFRLHARSLFLTYPHDTKGVCQEDIILMVKDRLQHVEWYIVAEEGADEDHQYKHYHVLIVGSKDFDIKSHNFLDINGVHGNYQTAKNRLKVYDYITKQNRWQMYSDIMTEEQLQSLVHNLNRKLFTKAAIARDDKFTKLLYDAVCIDNDITKVEQSVRDIIQRGTLNVNELKLLIQFTRNRKLYTELKEVLAVTQNRLTKPIFVHRSYLVFLYLWLSRRNKFGAPYTLFIQGSPGIGKTSIIQHLVGEEGLFIQHNDMLKQYNSTVHKYVIYDDINTKSIARSTLIHMTDSEQSFQADVKNSMVVVDCSTTKLMLSNERVDRVFPSKDGAIARRLYKCHIDTKDPYDICKESYSDVFGDSIWIYFKSPISYFYNIIINIGNKPMVEFDSNLASKLMDEGEQYVQLNYGLLTHYKNNLQSLELLLYGSKHDKHRIKFYLAKDILAKQMEYQTYHIPNKDMEVIFDTHVKGAMCICEYAKIATLSKQPVDCFVCWAKTYVMDEPFWRKLLGTRRF